MVASRCAIYVGTHGTFYNYVRSTRCGAHRRVLETTIRLSKEPMNAGDLIRDLSSLPATEELDFVYLADLIRYSADPLVSTWDHGDAREVFVRRYFDV